MELNNLKVTSKNILLIGILFFILPNISALIVSEIMYAPLESEFYNEYIEIYNNGESYLDLTNFTLCGDALLSGYVDHGDLEKLKLNDSIILPKGNYAIITDGGSGTEVYSNFNVNENALALHVDAASLCGGLVNSGETLSLKDSSGNSINSIIYDASLANNNDKSVQICSTSWIEEEPTPGSANTCPTQNSQIQTQQNQTNSNNNTPAINTETNNQTQDNADISANTTQNSNAVSESAPEQNQLEIKEKNSETIILNTNSKDIKSEENKLKLNKDNYAKYILTAFVILLILLFLLKKIFKKKYKNEFKK